MTKQARIDAGLKILEERDPKTLENNTEVCIAMWDMIFIRRGIPELTHAQKEAIRCYPPETIVRRRRKTKEGTSAQYAEEVIIRNQYTKLPLNPPLYES